MKYHILLPSVKDVGGAVDYYQWSAVLRSVSAFESYRKVYRDVITPIRLAELLILRHDIPRSLHFCLRQVHETLELVRNDRSAEAQRQAGQLLSQLQLRAHLGHLRHGPARVPHGPPRRHAGALDGGPEVLLRAHPRLTGPRESARGHAL